MQFEKQEVTVTDIQMPFWSMVKFIFKWTLASIPALIMIAILFGIIAAFSAAFISNLAGSIQRQQAQPTETR